MKKNQRNSLQKPNYSTLFHYARRFEEETSAKNQSLDSFEENEIENEKEKKKEKPNDPSDFTINSNSQYYIKKKKIPPPPPAPSIQQIDVVRYSWERVCELRLDNDDPHMSPAQGFGSTFYEALFEKDDIYKEKFGNNVIQQARVLAGIISFLTRSPSIKGESGSIQDINATKKQKLNEHQPPSPCSNLSFVELVEHTMNDPPFSSSLSALPSSSFSFLRRSSTASNYSDYQQTNNGCPFQHHQWILPPSPTSSIESEKGRTYMDDHQHHHHHHYRLSLQEQQEIEQYILKRQQLEHEKENQFFACKLKQLGASHLQYNLLPYHFDAIGPALITALRARLKEECVSHVENAWLKVYEFTAYHMKVGLAAQIVHEQEHQFKSSMSLSSLNSIDAGDSKCIIQ